jgi:disulfide oxidoreductase YuzD
MENMAIEKAKVRWLAEPEEHNYPAAKSYLSLIYDQSATSAWMRKLRRASITEFKAKDIFRASSLSLLGVSNSHLKADQRKIRNGEQLSPLLLIRDPSRGRVVIADGYHRLCAVYTFDEDAMIPCKIA